MASFFVVFFLLFSSASAFSYPKAVHAQWQALLHLHHGQPQIAGNDFLLSMPEFSTENEWQATKTLFENDPASICRFPARYLLMQPYEILPEFPSCPEYQQFLSKAPADEISVIYASENLTNPSSMMGHGMLSIAGQRQDGLETEHAVSFFVELDSINPFKLIWETLISGKDGFFLVNPLQHQVDFYRQQEQRNVWRYVLALTPQERHLIQAHLWELKFPAIDYYFDGHNCATLSLDILRLVRSDLPVFDIVSPLDLAKIVSEHQLVERTEVSPADKWQVRALNDSAPQAVRQAVATFRVSGQLPDWQNPQHAFLFKQLSQSLLDYDWHNSDLAPQQRAQKQQALNQLTTADLQLNLDDYKSPLNTPPDSQLAAGWLSYRDDDWLSLRWLPAAHTLEDDNRQYFGENELRLNELELRVSPQQQALQLHRWQIYSAASYTPRDSLLGGLSGKFQLGFAPVYDRRLTPQTGFTVSGGFGVTEALGRDLRAFALLNFGAEINPDQAFSYLEPEVGAYLYEVLDMKTWLRFRPQLRSDGRWLKRWNLSHSLSWQHSALVASAELLNLEQQWQRQWQLEWRWYY